MPSSTSQPPAPQPGKTRIDRSQVARRLGLPASASVAEINAELRRPPKAAASPPRPAASPVASPPAPPPRLQREPDGALTYKGSAVKLTGDGSPAVFTGSGWMTVDAFESRRPRPGRACARCGARQRGQLAELEGLP